MVTPADAQSDRPAQPDQSERVDQRGDRSGRLGAICAAPLVLLIRLYQRFISPMFPPSCRYYPSCSAYAVTALQRFGPVKGSWLALRRLLRCHPWAAGGVDHVPQRRDRHTATVTDSAPDADSTSAGSAHQRRP